MNIIRVGSDSPDVAFFVYDGGPVYDYLVDFANGARPVLGLKSDVKLLNAEAEGVGTKDSPMIIV